MTPHSWTSLGTYRQVSTTKTVPSGFTSSGSFGFRELNLGNGTVTSLYQLICGYRTILNTKNYINPVDGSISTTQPSISEKAFTSKCNNDTTTLVSGYSSYLASGIFMDDSGWELITGNEGSWTKTYSDNALNEENLGSSNCYLYYHTSLIVASSGTWNYGYIVIKGSWSNSSSSSYPTPKWGDYTATDEGIDGWNCAEYSLTSSTP